MNVESSYELIAILGMGVVTFGIRALPFLRIVPNVWLAKLEEKKAVFPTLFLALLVVYCLSPARSAPPAEAGSLLGCSALVAALQWYRGQLILSLTLGTAVYLYLLNH